MIKLFDFLDKNSGFSGSKQKKKRPSVNYYGSRRLRIFVERKYILFQSAMGTSTRIFRIKPMTASVVFQFKLLDLGQAYN